MTSVVGVEVARADRGVVEVMPCLMCSAVARLLNFPWELCASKEVGDRNCGRFKGCCVGCLRDKTEGDLCGGS